MGSSGRYKITSLLCLLEAWDELGLQARVFIRGLFNMVLLGYSEFLHNSSEFLKECSRHTNQKRPIERAQRIGIGSYQSTRPQAWKLTLDHFHHILLVKAGAESSKIQKWGHRIHISVEGLLNNFQPYLISHANLENYFLY